MWLCARVPAAVDAKREKGGYTTLGVLRRKDLVRRGACKRVRSPRSAHGEWEASASRLVRKWGVAGVDGIRLRPS